MRLQNYDTEALASIEYCTAAVLEKGPTVLKGWTNATYDALRGAALRGRHKPPATLAWAGKIV